MFVSYNYIKNVFDIRISIKNFGEKEADWIVSGSFCGWKERRICWSGGFQKEWRRAG
jgi:hypothetical protein